jgi:DNA-binding SARP family transcriptional activator
MEYRVLGPLEVVDEDSPVALGTVKERVVLAVLLLSANEVVSRDRLIDELWGESPPPTAIKAVNGYIFKLRKTLTRNGTDPIETATGGYRLSVDADQLDSTRVQPLLARARESASSDDLETASGLFQQALALWRGRALDGLELEGKARHEIEQLEELRLAALMDRIDCDLALGRQEQLIGELNRLVGEHPLRERLRAQQMLALYRADRQAEALDAYQQARQTLVDDLGIEPSEALQRLQKGILVHDPALEIPTGVGARNVLTPPPKSPVTAPGPSARALPAPRSVFSRRGLLIVLAVVAALALAGGLAVFATRASGDPPQVEPNSLVRLDPRTGKPSLVVPVGVEPFTIAITPTAIWTVNQGDNTVSRYDLRTHTVQPRAGFPGMPFDVVVDGDGNAWITSSGHDTGGFPARNAFVTRLQAGTGGTSPGALYPSHVHAIDLPLPMAGFEALGGGYLWVIVGGHGPNSGDDRVVLVDLRTSQVASVKRLHLSATAIAFGYGSAWIGTYGVKAAEIPDECGSATAPCGPSSWLEAIRPGDSKPTKVLLEKYASWGPIWIAIGDGAVWALAYGRTGALEHRGPSLFEIDPQTLRIIHRLDFSGDQNGWVTVGAGAVWTLNGNWPANGATVTEIDPHTDRIIHTTPLGNRTTTGCVGLIAATPSAIWATIGDKTCGTVGR